jgi:hypothetical protein
LEYERILKKEVYAQELLKDEVRPPLTRDAFLQDLLGVARPGSLES